MIRVYITCLTCLILFTACAPDHSAELARLRSENARLQSQLEQARAGTELVMKISDQWRANAEQCMRQLNRSNTTIADANRRIGKIIKESK
jgi:hypothetical protein